MKDRQRDTIRKIILNTLKDGEDVHWTSLKKKVLGSCCPFATDSTFARQIRYLMENAHIKRIKRGIYEITPKGQKYLEIL